MAWNFICVRCQSISDKEFNYCDNCGAMNSAAYFQKNKEEQTPVPCTCPTCIEEMKYAAEAKKHEEEQRAKHFNHPFYIDARKIWTNHQWAQIEKGAVKYPEPFTPSSWTNEQLVEHAIQENVDQLHYIVGMKERMEEQAKEIERLKSYEEYAMKEIEGLEKLKNSQIDKIIQYKRDIEILEKEVLKKDEAVTKLTLKNQDLDSENRTLKGEF
jgi:hypothetical protein